MKNKTYHTVRAGSVFIMLLLIYNPFVDIRAITYV